MKTKKINYDVQSKIPFFLGQSKKYSSILQNI